MDSNGNRQPGQDRPAIVFDLDDTLYKEVDFVRSGFRAVADLLSPCAGCDVYARLMELFGSRRSERSVGAFDAILREFEITEYTTEELLTAYRTHRPAIAAPAATMACLEQLHGAGFELGLMTDGRSITQRNKIEALGIGRYFSHILISEEFGSEKPDPRNYEAFEARWPGRRLIYIADNTGKDFITAKARGWQTVCLKCDGRNVHRQDFTLNEEYLPHFAIDDLTEFLKLLKDIAGIDRRGSGADRAE